MTRIKKILRFHSSGEQPTDSDSLYPPGTEYFDCDCSFEAIDLLNKNDFDAVLLPSNCNSGSSVDFVSVFRNQHILENMPDGVVLIDRESNVHWANQCIREWSGKDETANLKFSELFQNLEILGPDFCPFKSVNATGQSSRTFMKNW